MTMIKPIFMFGLLLLLFGRGGSLFAQTAETATDSIQPRMSVVEYKFNPKSLILTEEDCYNCPKLKEVFPNTIIPKRCPMLKAGNGIHGHHDGSILVGKQAAHGLLIHPRAAFDTLYERIRKNLERRREVTLVIEE